MIYKLNLPTSDSGITVTADIKVSATGDGVVINLPNDLDSYPALEERQS